jgi:hypothetical protein
MARRRWPSKTKTRGDRPGRAAIGLIALLLQACAPAGTGAGTADADEHPTVGDSGSVVVQGAGEEEHALPFANRHCAAYGKVAEFKAVVSHRLSRYATTKDVEFYCVRPSPTSPGPMSGR